MFFYDLGDKTLQSLGLQDADGTGVKAVDIMHIRDEVVGIGYAVNTSEELGECRVWLVLLS